METENAKPITVKVTLRAAIEKAWEFWTNPEHIKNWAFASPDWHVPDAKNDLREGGKFSTTMAAKDGSMGFDFSGTYTAIEENKLIEYVLDDGRRVNVLFEGNDESTLLTETFDPENTNPIEMQRQGWQAILDNFRQYTESH